MRVLHRVFLAPVESKIFMSLDGLYSFAYFVLLSARRWGGESILACSRRVCRKKKKRLGKI